jgi:hypothetical protein
MIYEVHKTIHMSMEVEADSLEEAIAAFDPSKYISMEFETDQTIVYDEYGNILDEDY